MFGLVRFLVRVLVEFGKGLVGFVNGLVKVW